MSGDQVRRGAGAEGELAVADVVRRTALWTRRRLPMSGSQEGLVMFDHPDNEGSGRFGMTAASFCS